MLLFMTVWACGAWAQNETSQEKLLYSTDFTDWDDIDRKVTVNKEVKLKTQFSDEDLIFTLKGVGADPKGTNSKFPSYTGYMITAKQTEAYKKAEPSAVTSRLKSITKIVLTQAATGSKRGIKVSVKGANDTEWVALHNKTIENSKGETLTIDVNRTNCQIKFENFTLGQNAYIVDLKIYGNSDGGEKKVRTLDFPPQDGIVGKYPSKIKCDNDGHAVMPEGNGFSLPGYTFVAWTDGTNDYTPGTTVIASGEAIIDYMLDYWKEGDNRVKEGYTNEFTTDDKDHTYIAHFRQGNVGNIVFDFGGERVNGADEKDNYKGAESKLFTHLNNIRSFTIPNNYTFFKSVDKDGKPNPNFYTLDHWTLKSDTTQHYELGEHYSFGTEGETITLVPVFRANPTNTENRSNAPIIRYDFGRKVHEYRGQTSGVIRNVCAPTINIGSNQKFFWTTQAYIETYESGKKYNYRRDIAMWCDTGTNGYIRNTDFDDWAAFGPNTTFWLIAGVGTEIRLLTYSPITTTTIDGVVPTLDKARTDSVRKVSGKNYMYVYTHTTQSAADRIPLVIGDDYTYYQWLEIHMQAANWVNLYTNVDNQNRGSIKEINVSETQNSKTSIVPKMAKDILSARVSE